jgi:hypothetical protein
VCPVLKGEIAPLGTSVNKGWTSRGIRPPSGCMITPKGSKKPPAGGGTDVRTLALSPLNRLAEFAPLVVRVIVGVIMSAHGWQKLMGDRPTSQKASPSKASPCRG